jgi:heme-degrading monooxygenase HmoA
MTSRGTSYEVVAIETSSYDAVGLIGSLGDMPVVKINAISVPPEAHEELEKRFSNRAHTVDGSPGFLGFQLLRPVKGEDRYFVVTTWEDEESFAAWRDGPAIEAHSGQRAKPVASGADLLEFEVVMDVRAGE